MRLFWRLTRLQNPHIRRVCCGFSDFGNPQNSSPYTIYFGSSRGIIKLPKTAISASAKGIQNSKFKIQNWLILCLISN